MADITYVPTWAGFLYLAVVLDVWSRRGVGWSMQTHLRTELVIQALDMALAQRRPTGVIHHSDQGSQYTAVAFGNRCVEEGVELQSLVDYEYGFPALSNAAGTGQWAEGDVFAGVQSSDYWSSASSAGGPSGAWFVGLSGGVVGYDGKTYALYVWPVRGGQ